MRIASAVRPRRSRALEARKTTYPFAPDLQPGSRWALVTVTGNLKEVVAPSERTPPDRTASCTSRPFMRTIIRPTAMPEAGRRWSENTPRALIRIRSCVVPTAEKESVRNRRTTAKGALRTTDAAPDGSSRSARTATERWPIPAPDATTTKCHARRAPGSRVRPRSHRTSRPA